MRPTPIPSFPRGKTQRGATLIEVVASAIILGLTFLAVTTMFRISREIEYRQNEVFQAETLSGSILEEEQYRYSNFSGLPLGETIRPAATDTVLYLFERSKTVRPSLLKITIDSSITLPGAWNNQALPYKRIQVQINWHSQTFQLTKWITQQ